MDFLRTYAKELVSLTVPVVSALITRLTRNRVRLIWASPHGFTFLPQPPPPDAHGHQAQVPQLVHTRSFWLVNAGRATAHNVEIVFNYPAQCLNVWPSRHYDVRTEVDNRHILTLATLAPKENFGCELLNVNINLPDLITLRCDEGVGRQINMRPYQVQPMWKVRLYLVAAFLGAVTAIYLLLIALQWLLLKTPTVL